MEFERYLELDRILPAFRFRDIQTAATIYAWVSANSFDMEDIRSYTVTYPVMEQLYNIGYFVSGDVEHSKRMKEFEKSLPVEIRKPLRAERLHRLKNESSRPRKP